MDNPLPAEDGPIAVGHTPVGSSSNRLAVRVLLPLLIPLLVLPAGPGDLHAEDADMTLELRSNAFHNGGEIPPRYTCEGEDIAPPLTWGGVPERAQSLVLIVDDPDAPDPRAPKMTWVHWVLFDIPVGAKGLPEAAGSSDLPAGTKAGLNDWRRTGYGGPCPPIGRHRYFFKLYALDTTLALGGAPSKEELEAAMAAHVLESAVLIGTYQKRGR